jgi:hypothetical protein
MGMLPQPVATATLLRDFLKEVRTLAVTSQAECELGDRHEATDPDRAILHLQASVDCDAQLVELITGPRGRMCLNQLDLILRSGVVA